MPTFQMQAEPPHGLLFISDDSGDWTLPDQLEETLTCNTKNCVCFKVLHLVDGASLVTVTDKDCNTGGKKYFSGVIQSTTGRLAVSDTATFQYLIIPVSPGQVAVDIWAEAEINPTWVWIKLGSIRMSDYTDMPKFIPY